MSGSSERPSDPSKKYWWLAAVIVPVVVALIGIVPSFLNTASGSHYITNNQLDGDMYFTTNISVEDPALQQEVQRAVELAQQKQYAQSAQAFEALAAQIQSAEIYNNLGVVQAAAGNMGPARTAYQQALALDPQFQGAHLNIGLIDKAEGKWLEAKEHFDRAGELRGAAGKVDEIDRHFGNNDILNATPIKVEATVSAEIVTPDDMDFYQFTAPPEPRDHLRVSLANRSSTLSPSFHFYDGKKSEVTSHSNGTPGADLSYDLATQPNETYYVKVFGRALYDAPSSAGAYELSISALKLFDRYEPNDEILRAVQIRVGVPVEAEIMDPPDVDFYQFTVGAVNTVTVTLNTESVLSLLRWQEVRLPPIRMVRPARIWPTNSLPSLTEPTTCKSLGGDCGTPRPPRGAIPSPFPLKLCDLLAEVIALPWSACADLIRGSDSGCLGTPGGWGSLRAIVGVYCGSEPKRRKDRFQ